MISGKSMKRMSFRKCKAMCYTICEPPYYVTIGSKQCNVMLISDREAYFFTVLILNGFTLLFPRHYILCRTQQFKCKEQVYKINHLTLLILKLKPHTTRTQFIKKTIKKNEWERLELRTNRTDPCHSPHSTSPLPRGGLF